MLFSPRLLWLVLGLSLPLMAHTCTSSSVVPAEASAQLPLLARTWLHAHEEDADGLEVYRPNTFAFPPSRGRTGFTFEGTGNFTQLGIAPTDGMQSRPGRWTAVAPGRVRIQLTDQSEPAYELEIVELTTEMLKVRRLP